MPCWKKIAAQRQLTPLDKSNADIYSTKIIGFSRLIHKNLIYVLLRRAMSALSLAKSLFREDSSPFFIWEEVGVSTTPLAFGECSCDVASGWNSRRPGGRGASKSGFPLNDKAVKIHLLNCISFYI